MCRSFVACEFKILTKQNKQNEHLHLRGSCFFHAYIYKMKDHMLMNDDECKFLCKIMGDLLSWH
ncbi:unnamed protein product [Amoebophrya sp. A120]|nr:unnamed protein product [Amoebophrya sp. A120]